jgi:hypothetical protein
VWTGSAVIRKRLVKGVIQDDTLLSRNGRRVPDWQHIHRLFLAIIVSAFCRWSPQPICV